MLARLRERRRRRKLPAPCANGCLRRGGRPRPERVLGKMRQDAQLDLRIVGGKQHAARRRDERGADFAAQLGAHRNILQIRIRRAQAARRGARLAEARVQASRRGMDQPRQGVRIGGFQFRELAIFENFFGKVVDEGQLFQNFGGRRARFRRGSARRLQIQLVEENFGELLRAS